MKLVDETSQNEKPVEETVRRDKTDVINQIFRVRSWQEAIDASRSDVAMRYDSVRGCDGNCSLTREEPLPVWSSRLHPMVAPEV